MSDRDARTAMARQGPRGKSRRENFARALLVAAVASAGLLAAIETADAFWFFRPDPPPSMPVRPGQLIGPDGKPLVKKKRPLAPVRARLMSDEEKAQHAELLENAKKGPLLAVISLNEQELVLYANGVEIARTNVSTGTRGHPTPTGIFSILQKNLFHRSNLYSDAPMPYMQRITWSGVALHQGVLPGYPASHGCIRMPDLFARQLWTMTELGARVVITQGPVEPVAFEHARLFAAPPKDDALPAPSARRGRGSGEPAAPPVKLAAAGATATDAGPATIAADGGMRIGPDRLRDGAITVLVSRKEGRIFVRKGRAPVFDAPIAIDRPDEPIGTHLYTALAVEEGEANFRWSALSVPSLEAAEPPAQPRSKARKDGHRPAPPAAPEFSPADALDRLQIPPEVTAQIARLMSTGASLVITDHGLGRETGKETDFIVETHSSATKPIRIGKPKPKPARGLPPAGSLPQAGATIRNGLWSRW